jgi:hypothetical protein
MNEINFSTVYNIIAILSAIFLTTVLLMMKFGKFEK